MTILSRLKRSGVNAEAGNRPYVTDDDYPTQMRKRIQKAVNDLSPQVQSELVRPYKASIKSYPEHEYYQVPPPGIEPWPTPIFDPIPLPTFRVQTPIFSVASGTYSSAQTVQIVCLTAGATIYYTLDNTEPTVHKTKYTTALVVSANTTIKARAFKDGMDASNIAKAEYLIVIGTDLSYLLFSDASGEFLPFYITNIEFNNDGWETKFNTSFWTPAAGQGSWDGVKWVSEWDGSVNWNIQLTPNGTWHQNYRPTQMRISFFLTDPDTELSAILLASRKATAGDVTSSPVVLDITW